VTFWISDLLRGFRQDEAFDEEEEVLRSSGGTSRYDISLFFGLRDRPLIVK